MLLLISCSTIESWLKFPAIKLSPHTAGKRRHKRIGIQKVSGPLVPLPPEDTLMKDSRRRKFASKTLITPRDIRPSSRQPLTVENAQLKSSSPNRTSDSPKVESAPTNLQLSLGREETFTAISRSSTIFEDNIGFTLLTEKSNVSSRISPRKSKSRQSNITQPSARKQSTESNIRKPSTNNVMTPQKKIGLTVKSLDKSKNGYVKYAKAVFKDRNAVYRKKVKLVGIIKKRKVNKSATSMKRSATVADRNSEQGITKLAQKTVSKDTVDLGSKLVKELKKPRVLEVTQARNETKQDPEPQADDPEKPERAEDFDDNFFMCSNEDDNAYAEHMKSRQKEYELEEKSNRDNKYLNSRLDLPTKVPFVKNKVSSNKKESNGNKTNAANSMIKNIESLSRFSIVRQKTSVTSRNTIKKSSKEAIIEEKVVAKLFYNYDFKVRSKIVQRRRRHRRTFNLSRDFKRIPTLIDWVECSDILSTAAMKMQNKLKDNSVHFDHVKNQRYKV